MQNNNKKKLLIINNIGSPVSYQTKDVRRYLREFLMDPKVIQISLLIRFILVYVIISLFRASKSAAKYKSIWLTDGSPLLVFTGNFITKLQVLLPEFEIRMGMRYQNPSILSALNGIEQFDQVIFAPMYPQYAESTTESAIQKFKKDLSKTANPLNKQPQIKILKPFWADTEFIQSWTNQILNSNFDLNNYSILLLSYHGLPESQLKKNSFCQFDQSCCDLIERACAGCYRSQCFQTSKLIEQQLFLKNPSQKDKIKILTTFQSRLGKAKWIEPYTDKTLIQLAQNSNSRKVLVACPAFTTDCLETLEEIHIENRSEFISHGGEKFDVIPCLNDSDHWTKAFSSLIKSL